LPGTYINNKEVELISIILYVYFPKTGTFTVAGELQNLVSNIHLLENPIDDNSRDILPISIPFLGMVEIEYIVCQTVSVWVSQEKHRGDQNNGISVQNGQNVHFKKCKTTLVEVSVV